MPSWHNSAEGDIRSSIWLPNCLIHYPFFLLLGNIDFLEEAPKQSIGPVMLFVTGRQPISNEARAKHPLMRCVKCPCAGGLSFNEVRSTVVTARLQFRAGNAHCNHNSLAVRCHCAYRNYFRVPGA